MTTQNHWRHRISALVLTCVLAGAACGASVLHVSPDGNDTWDGTRARKAFFRKGSGPFRTLERARDEIRKLKKEGALPDGEVIVQLGAGVHRLDQTFALGPEDSGTIEAPIVYRAAPRADVWISGGTMVDPNLFEMVTDASILTRLPEKARAHVLQLKLSDAGITDFIKDVPDKFSGFTRNEPQFAYVFCNGDQMQWARWPNEGYAKFAEIIDSGSGLRDHEAQRTKKFRPGVFSYTGNRPERWDVERGVWMMGFWARAYVCDVVRVGNIDTQKKEITWKVPLRFGLDTWGANRWYAFNLLEELDAPGEWYIDRNAGVLYFWPPKAIGKCQVMLTRLKDPLVTTTDTQHVTFQGIGFEGGRGDAVVIKKGNAVELLSCEVRNIARNAVTLVGGTNHKVTGCDIHHVGYSGVIMSGGDRKTLAPANHVVANCHIHHTNTVKRTHASPINMRGVGLTLSHNLIHHAPHSAVFYGGNDLTMEYNDIYWCHFETAEGGVFYAGYNWTYRNNRIQHNYIHHINDSLDGSPTGVNVVHLDDCVAGTTFRGNVVYRVGRGVSMCGGPWNVADNNLFIDCQVGISLSARGLAWWDWTKHPDGTVTARDKRASHGFTTNNGLLRKLKQVPWDKQPYTKYPNMDQLLNVDPIGAPWWCAITRNIAINGPLMRVARNVKPEWVEIRGNWDSKDLGDPGVIAPYGEEYALKANAAAGKLGFEPIPFEKIGLVNDGTRRTWPVKSEPPPADFRPCWLRRREMEKRMPGGLPVVAVRRAGAVITVDGAVDPEEWTPGEKQTVSVNTVKPEILQWRAIGGKATFPSTVHMQVDDERLYLAFINDVQSEGGIAGGHTWGHSDAAEFAVSVAAADNELGPIMIWRGFTDGTLATSDEAGAPKAVVERCRQGVQYACKIVSKTRWTAEFAIPFAAMGISPEKQNPRMLFSLAVRKVSGNEWVTWKKPPGGSWDVRKGGVLWLEPFGDIVLNGAVPSWARCEIRALGEGLLMDGGTNCEVLGWAKPLGRRLSAKSGELGVDWQPFTFRFTPKADGRARIELRGRPLRSTLNENDFIPVWTYWDNLRIEGAKLVNGDFEEADPKTGLLRGWQKNAQALWMRTPGVAASGEGCVKSWFLHPVSQTIEVQKGVAVTIRCQIRGEVAQ